MAYSVPVENYVRSPQPALPESQLKYLQDELKKLERALGTIGSALNNLSWAGGLTNAVTTFSGGTTGLTPATDTFGLVTLAGTLAVANGGTGVTTSTGSDANVLSTSPTLVTPVLGDATGTSLAVSSTITSSGGGIGYAVGAGGSVTQATSKATGVTLDKLSGTITLSGADLAAGAIVSFTLTNITIAATDVLILNHVTTGTAGAYGLNAACGAGSAVISIRNHTAASLAEAIVLSFVVIKAVTT